jgi:hypothetical protein
MRNKIAIFLLVVSLPGCIEEYELKLDEINPRLVVEGLITNKKGPYYIRLTESHVGNFIEPDFSNIDNAKGVKDAKIIISDNVNQIDTLIPVDFDLHEYTWDYYLGYYKLVYDYSHNVIDTLFLTDPIDFTYDRGFYKTNNLTGIPGRTYSIRIFSKDKEYKASSFMPPVPEIDSIGVVKKISEKDNAEYFIPLLYFSEPQETKDYYLIQLNEEISIRTYSASTLWQFSILSDEFLQPYVNGLNISLGETPRSIEYPIYQEGDSVYVALSSLTQDAYEFYKILLHQFKNDGGAYQPAPGSPPTNMSNSALGYFRASAVSEKRIKIPRPF